MTSSRRRVVWALVLFGWMAAVVALFYSTQRPIPAPVWLGLARAARDLGVAFGLSWLAWQWGERVLQRWALGPDPAALGSSAALTLLASWGLGMAFLSWGTLLLAGLGWAWPGVFRGLTVLLLLGLGWRNQVRPLQPGLRERLRMAWRDIPAKGVVLFLASVSALLALAPPEAFDTLLYHLAQPEWLLRHGRLQPWPIYQFWHPSLIEGAFTWALAWGSEGAAQLIGVIYSLGVLGVAAHWARLALGRRAARYTIWVLASMPSWLILAAGAYVDWPLAFYALLAFFFLWQGSLRPRPERAWRGSALFLGLALSTKTTSVPFGPVWAGLVLAWSGGTWWARVRRLLSLGLWAGLVMSPYYLRNAWYMSNPFYPFVFGGRLWDAFRMRWLAAPGTGLGLAWREWLLLPWTLTLGYRDVAYYHGRLGPLYLALAPLALVFVFHTLRKRHGLGRRRAVLTWSLAFAAAAALWAVGVARSAELFQGRLLFPALALWAPVTAYVIPWSRVLNTRALRFSFLVRVLALGVLSMTLLEDVVFVTSRAPWRYILGFEDRDAYWARVLPDWADVRALLHTHTQPQDRILFYFEPRGYGLEREVLADSILDNFAHALHLYGGPDAVLRALQCQGYTHILLYRRGWDFVREHIPHMQAESWSPALESLLARLTLVARQGNYELYRIPPPSAPCAPSSPGTGHETDSASPGP
ncbi:MAG: hypothetical protein GXO36_04065 [Chloroflexi bacterium]|nr:hypothetical protein [Chloroflexota bacterium]